MEDYTDEEAALRKAFLPAVRAYDRADRLGSTVKEYISIRRKEMKKNASVVDSWRNIVGRELGRQCEISGISRGILYIEVTPGPYMHELRLMSDELVDEFGRRCGVGVVKRIVLVPKKQETAESEELS